jgi:hypothetical protein
MLTSYNGWPASKDPARVDEMHFEVCVNAKKAAKRILKLSQGAAQGAEQVAL